MGDIFELVNLDIDFVSAVDNHKGKPKAPKSRSMVIKAWDAIKGAVGGTAPDAAPNMYHLENPDGTWASVLLSTEAPEGQLEVIKAGAKHSKATIEKLHDIRDLAMNTCGDSECLDMLHGTGRTEEPGDPDSYSPSTEAAGAAAMLMQKAQVNDTNNTDNTNMKELDMTNDEMVAFGEIVSKAIAEGLGPVLTALVPAKEEPVVEKAAPVTPVAIVVDTAPAWAADLVSKVDAALARIDSVEKAFTEKDGQDLESARKRQVPPVGTIENPFNRTAKNAATVAQRREALRGVSTLGEGLSKVRELNRANA